WIVVVGYFRVYPREIDRQERTNLYRHTGNNTEPRAGMRRPGEGAARGGSGAALVVQFHHTVVIAVHVDDLQCHVLVRARREQRDTLAQQHRHDKYHVLIDQPVADEQRNDLAAAHQPDVLVRPALQFVHKRLHVAGISPDGRAGWGVKLLPRDHDRLDARHRPAVIEAQHLPVGLAADDHAADVLNE